MTDVVELRVHGVGGTPPEDMLKSPYPELVSGDRTAGFFRARSNNDKLIVEAYSWGGLTSRSFLKALWLLLLPFGLCNIAGWMSHSPISDKRLPAIVWRALVRITALFTTILPIVWMGWLTVWTLAVQCGSQPDCRDRAFLYPLRLSFVEGHVGRLAVIGILMPLAVLGIWVWLGRATRSRYTCFEPDHLAERSTHRGRIGVAWDEAGLAARLSSLHTAGALSLLSLAFARGFWAPASSRLYWIPLGSLLLVVAGLALAERRVISLAFSRISLTSTLLFLMVILGWAWDSPNLGAMSLAEARQGYGEVGLLIIMVAVAQLLPMLLIGLIKRNTTAGFNGLGPFVSATLSFGIITAAMGSLGIFLDSWLAEAGVAVTVSPSNDWLAASLTAGMGFLIMVLLVYFAYLRLKSREPKNSARFWHVLRQFISGIDTPITWLALLIVASSVGGPLLRMVNGSPLAGLPQFPYPAVARLSATAVLLIPVALVLVLRRSLKSSASRRHVGITWDVITFWPRSFHPFAPPSYAERAVPELQERIVELQDDRIVAVSAHSQGTVIAACALDGLRESREKIALLTHGSPLSRLYGKYFPAYFNRDLFITIAKNYSSDGAKGVRWRNLYRLTDPIGGGIASEERRDGGDGGDGAFLDPIDREVPDPPSASAGRHQSDWVRGHSDYAASPEYDKAIKELIDLLTNQGEARVRGDASSNAS